MNKKIFLTSAVIMCMACPAIAENFPGDGNMLENKTYDNAATYANTGIYEGDVTADAEYSLNPYSVAAGSYFTGINNDNTAATAQCTSGNYCPGVASTTFDNNAFGDTGLRACPANYSGSAAGATANTDCYRACSTTDVAKSATVSGQMYYDGTSSDGVNACVPETCVSGWHVKAATPDLTTVIGTSKGPSRAYINANGSFTEDSASYGQSFYGISGANTWAVNCGNSGILVGQARCSTQSGQAAWDWSNDTAQTPTTFASLTDETGQEGAQYCYCNVTGYTPASGTLQSVSSSWLFGYDYGNASNCASGCANFCSSAMRGAGADGLAIRAALLGSVAPSLASCEANQINITWNDASAEDIAATGAATTVYEGDIKTPLKAITKPGKTFVGWKFIKTQQ